MNKPYRILIADDDDTFLHSTADLLRERGYRCDCVSSGAMAEKFLQKASYNLLISDINMSGNTNLEFIRTQADARNDLPVILITGYPTIETAADSLQLPVIAYLVKPVDFEALVRWVEIGLKANSSLSSMTNIRQHLRAWDDELEALQQTMHTLPKSSSSSPVEQFISNSFNNLAGTLLDMKHLITASLSGEEQPSACHLLNCPRYLELHRAIEESIAVLEKTKNAFKSKELGELRKRLIKISGDKINY